MFLIISLWMRVRHLLPRAVFFTIGAVCLVCMRLRGYSGERARRILVVIIRDALQELRRQRDG
jgi:hypothetical protein